MPPSEPPADSQTFSIRASAPAKLWASVFGALGALLSGGYFYQSKSAIEAQLKQAQAASEQAAKDSDATRQQLQERVCLLESQLVAVTAVVVRDKAADAERDKTRKQSSANYAESYFRRDVAHWVECTEDTRIDLSERRRRSIEMAIKSALEAPAPR